MTAILVAFAFAACIGSFVGGILSSGVVIVFLRKEKAALLAELGKAYAAAAALKHKI